MKAKLGVTQFVDNDLKSGINALLANKPKREGFGCVPANKYIIFICGVILSVNMQ